MTVPALQGKSISLPILILILILTLILIVLVPPGFEANLASGIPKLPVDNF